MEKGKEGLPEAETFYAVLVEDIVLRNPVPLVPERHTDGKWFGPEPTQFGDESAERLLRNIINANPEQAAKLTRIYEKFFGQFR